MDDPLSGALDAGPVHGFAHPDRLAVRAALHGLAVRSPRAATVLEIGCRDGDDVLALASLWPAARFVGVDRSGERVARASAQAHALGVKNASFAAWDADGGDPDELPEADYVIAVGLASHLRPEARRALLAAIGARLRPGGAAVVSFDVAAGTTDLEPLRALMRFHVRNVGDDARAVRGARQIAAWHVARRSDHRPDQQALLERVAAAIAAMPDAALLRLLREPEHHALSLAELAAELAAAGLQWLTNARMEEPSAAKLPGTLREIALSGDAVRRQQYLDYFLMTAQRTSIVCRADERVDRVVSAEGLRRFHVAGRVGKRVLDEASPNGVLTLESAVGEVTLSRDAVRVLRVLAPVMPAARPVDELLGEVELDATRALAALFELWRDDAIELSLAPPTIAHAPSERPLTGAFQRAQAEAQAGAASGEATSLWHRDWSLDGDEIATLARLDGTSARDELDAEALRKLAHKGFLAG